MSAEHQDENRIKKIANVCCYCVSLQNLKTNKMANLQFEELNSLWR